MLGLDPTDPDFRQDPYATYRRLRESTPVLRSPAGFWVLTRHRECELVLRDQRFGYPAAAAAAPACPASGGAALPGGFADQRHMLIFMNPPEHTRLRRVLRDTFGPRVMRSATGYVEERTGQLLDRALRSGEPCDLISSLAHPLPFGVICHLLGVPGPDHAKIEKWAQDYLAGVSPSFTVSKANHQGRDEALAGLNDYFRVLAAQRRRAPGEDVLSRLIAAQDDGRISEEELLGTCILLFVAGHGTTTNLIGNGALALLRHPGQLARFRAEPELAASAVEELLRYDSPSHLSIRVAFEDVDLGEGNVVRAGEQVIVVRGAANRDPEVFADPDTLDLGRPDNRHLSFASGLHVCFGAPLARTQAKIALGALFNRAPHLALADERLEYKPSLLSRALEALPVTTRP
ncbi:cytochrome P450 [Streptomyces beihaiensis]|uniref:Cytochrome P450 n=1 Tax=Streptomyces beihaiensis TaxID=2984495 RepID=A0ABT3TV71_9ACTN|nr:cytochrome P450 [Streptomyces beihaiensis]MCX3060312.1 cytochrome P450 [Streptomyces beihaiensis]